MKRKLIWIILGVALLLRTAAANYPMGFNADEASFGYDAYSILKTGKDQWGNSFPIVLKSFGDFKSPLYSYLSIPFVYIFGLNIFAVRLPAIIIGTLAVYMVYLLTKKISISETVALLSAFLLAVNPWAIMISRGAVEAGLTIFLLPLSIYLFLQKKYSLSAIFFGLNMFSYHSAKFITPFVVVGLIVIYGKVLFNTDIKKMLLPLLILLIFTVGLIFSFKLGGGSRIVERSINQGALLAGFDERVYAISKGQNPVLAKILHNKYTITAQRFINNYLQYFSVRFLFKEGVGDGSYTMRPGIGVLTITEGVLVIGCGLLFFYFKKYRKLILVLLLWLFVAPIPSALASGVGYSGNRASSMLPVWQVIAGFGYLGWYEVLKNKNSNIIYMGIFAVAFLVIFNIVLFVNTYFKIPQNQLLRQMNYGNLDVASWINDYATGQKIIVSRSLSEPHVFFAFENKIDPNFVHSESQKWDLKAANVSWLDQIPSYSLGKITITSIDWKNINQDADYLVSRAEETPEFIIPLKTFYYPDGKPNIYIIDTSQKLYALK